MNDNQSENDRDLESRTQTAHAAGTAAKVIGTAAAGLTMLYAAETLGETAEPHDPPEVEVPAARRAVKHAPPRLPESRHAETRRLSRSCANTHTVLAVPGGRARRARIELV